MSSTLEDLVIVGGGPAGYTAAIYAARAQLRPLVFEGSQFGGALMTTTEVENYPGFPNGVDGPELMDRMRCQAERFGARLITEDVESVQLAGPVKTVTVDDAVHRARAVVLAMGAAALYLGVPGEGEFLGHGVSTCATCDGFFFRGKDIAVAGGGDTAMEEAVFLTRFARSVTIVHRRAEFRASRIMLERAQANPAIHWRTDSVITEVFGEKTVAGLTVRDNTTGLESPLAVDGLFVSIGHRPRSALVADQIDTGPQGHVRVRPFTSETSLDGVFACGDLVDDRYRQAATAVGSGCAAAIDAERYLTETPTPGHSLNGAAATGEPEGRQQ